MAYQTIRWERAAHTATVTLNRPEQRNSITGEMMGELYEVLSEAFTITRIFNVRVGLGGNGNVANDLACTEPGSNPAYSPEIEAEPIAGLFRFGQHEDVISIN